MSAEGLDKVRLIIKPVGDVVRVKEGWLKKFQSSPSEVRECEGHLVRVIRIDRIAADKEITKEDEIIKLSGFGTIKGVGFLSLGFFGWGITIAELLGHEHDCFS